MKMKFGPRFCLVVCLTVAGLGVGCSSETDTPSAGAVGGTEVLSADGKPLGNVSFPTSCDDSARELLERALALLHHMTYVEAGSTFRAAAEADPDCAIAYWGAAMTYVHPLWPDVVSDENLARGQELLERAMTASHRSEREDAYVEALRAYYRGGEPSSEMERLLGFLEGWADVHSQFPDDVEASLFYALAQLATAPASDKSYEKQKEAGAIAEKVGARIPGHPGANHYTIHAYDVPPLAERALDAARHYGAVAPENSHALHMPSHIFTRLGLWPESIAYNLRAADASSERSPASSVSMHHFHALDYLAYAHLQTADDVAARQVFDAVQALEEPFQNHAGTAYTLAAVPSRYALERHQWSEAADVEVRGPDGVPWDQYPHLEAIPYFARALGSARTGDIAAAQKAIAELARLQEAASSLNMAYDWGIQVEIQRTAAEAWLAYEGGDKDRALELMRKAAEMEGSTEKNPITPGEVLPASELFGDMLLASGQYDEARQQYEAALARSPNRFNSLYGAGRAAELASDSERAARFYGKLLENCPEPTGERAELDHARAFISPS